MGKVNSKNESTDICKETITANLTELSPESFDNDKPSVSSIEETEKDDERETHFKKEFKLTLSECEDEKRTESLRITENEGKQTSTDGKEATNVNEEVVNHSQESGMTQIGLCVCSEPVTFPVSEAEKMLQLYKNERALYHADAYKNKRDKVKHRPSPRYKTSDTYEVGRERLCTPTQVESDMIVHPSTSVETSMHEGEPHEGYTTPIHDTGDIGVTNEYVNRCKAADDCFLSKEIKTLTKGFFEDRSPYTRDARLKPVGTGKLGRGKVSLWFELMEQGMVVPNHWSEVSCKQQEVMTELMSSGILRKNNSEKRYTMSIGAPRRRPPPRLNQIPPIERNTVEFSDLFSSKIPSITTDKAGENESTVEKESAKTNVIAVTEADENRKLVNIAADRQENKTTITNLQLVDESQNNRKNRFVDLLNSREGMSTPTDENSMNFVEKEMKQKSISAKERINDMSEPDITNNYSITETDQMESEYFDVLGRDRYSEIQTRKLRLWDIDMI